jgi:hypothetical protein
VENNVIEQVPMLVLKVLDVITSLQLLESYVSFLSLLILVLERFFLTVRNRVEVLQKRR